MLEREDRMRTIEYTSTTMVQRKIQITLSGPPVIPSNGLYQYTQYSESTVLCVSNPLYHSTGGQSVAVHTSLHYTPKTITGIQSMSSRDRTAARSQSYLCPLCTSTTPNEALIRSSTLKSLTILRVFANPFTTIPTLGLEPSPVSTRLNFALLTRLHAGR